MTIIWAGTVPALVGVGAAIQSLAGPLRRHVPTACAVALIVVGLLAVPVARRCVLRRPRPSPPATMRAEPSLAGACSHCTLPVPPALLRAGDARQFCCEACRTVWDAIHEQGLERFYAMRGELAAGPAKTTDKSYAEMDDPSFVARACTTPAPGLAATDLYLEGSEDTRPGAGATAAFLEASTGRRAYFLGKPNGYMFHRACRRLADMGGTPKLDQVVMIGDTMETHIRGADEAGLQGYLVLSGSTRIESLSDYVYQPTRVLNSVADLVEELKTGKPSDRLDSPVFAAPAPSPIRNGKRHQTDFEQRARPRPRAPMTR